MSTVDVVVVGGGPVGLATALEAAAAGLSVTVVEQRAGTVDKACGEGLMPGAVAGLARLGVDPTGTALGGIRYLAGRHEAVAPFPSGPGRGVRRTELHAALAHRAEDAGVRRYQARVSDVRVGSGGVGSGGVVTVEGRTAEGGALSVRTRWVVAADGLHSPLRRRLGLAVPAGRAPLRYGLRRHYRLEPWTDLVEVHWGRDAECYLTPVAGDLLGVAVLGPAGSGFEDRLQAFPAVSRRLRSAEAVGPVLGAGPLRQRSRSVGAGRVLMVGDAAGYVDALTGEGIAVGLASARALVDCLVREAPQDYEQAWRRASRRYRVLTQALVWAGSVRPLRAAIVPAAARAPRVFAAVVGQLAR